MQPVEGLYTITICGIDFSPIFKQKFYKLAEINAQDHDGLTPLHLAVESGSEEVVETLIAKGADVNVADHKGLRPLHLAFRFDQDGVKALLLAKGADINALDKNRKKPHDFAPSREEFYIL